MLLKEFLAETTLPRDLARAVSARSGGWREFVKIAPAVIENGADRGFFGWTFHQETCSFTRRWKGLILTILQKRADVAGIALSELVAKQPAFRYRAISREETAAAVYGGRGPRKLEVQRAMAWFALETMATEYLKLVEKKKKT